MSQYVHHVPGRLRVRVPGVKGNLEEAVWWEKRIRAQRGVKNVQASPLTGSVLVHYDPATASVSTLSQMMLCSAGTETVSRALSASPPPSANERRNQQIATHIVMAVAGRVMETAVERAAVALIAAIL